MCSDESVIGGLSLLLMAGQHAATVASPPLTAATSNNRLPNTVTLSSQEAPHPQPCQVNSAPSIFVIVVIVVM